MVATTHTPSATSYAGSASDFTSFPSDTPPGSRAPTPTTTQAVDTSPEAAVERLASQFVRESAVANPSILHNLDEATAKAVLSHWLGKRAELMGFVREEFSLYTKKAKAGPKGHYIAMDPRPAGYGEEPPVVYRYNEGVLESPPTARYLIIRGVGSERIVKTE